MPPKKKSAQKKPAPRRSKEVAAILDQALQKHKELGLALAKLQKNKYDGDDPHWNF